jgi:hypothetical protein
MHVHLLIRALTTIHDGDVPVGITAFRGVLIFWKNVTVHHGF